MPAQLGLALRAIKELGVALEVSLIPVAETGQEADGYIDLDCIIQGTLLRKA